MSRRITVNRNKSKQWAKDKENALAKFESKLISLGVDPFTYNYLQPKVLDYRNGYSVKQERLTKSLIKAEDNYIKDLLAADRKARINMKEDRYIMFGGVPLGWLGHVPGKTTRGVKHPARMRTFEDVVRYVELSFDSMLMRMRNKETCTNVSIVIHNASIVLGYMDPYGILLDRRLAARPSSIISAERKATQYISLLYTRLASMNNRKLFKSYQERLQYRKAESDRRHQWGMLLNWVNKERPKRESTTSPANH